jgi:hypothetical protein
MCLSSTQAQQQQSRQELISSVSAAILWMTNLAKNCFQVQVRLYQQESYQISLEKLVITHKFERSFAIALPLHPDQVALPHSKQ